jgi:hypothetical protein
VFLLRLTPAARHASWGEGGETKRRKEAEEEEVNRRVVGEDVLEARERRVRV